MINKEENIFQGFRLISDMPNNIGVLDQNYQQRIGNEILHRFSKDNKFHKEEVKKLILELKGHESAKFVLKKPTFVSR